MELAPKVKLGAELAPNVKEDAAVAGDGAAFVFDPNTKGAELLVGDTVEVGNGFVSRSKLQGAVSGVSFVVVVDPKSLDKPPNPVKAMVAVDPVGVFGSLKVNPGCRCFFSSSSEDEKDESSSSPFFDSGSWLSGVVGEAAASKEAAFDATASPDIELKIEAGIVEG